jgi:hypothetical protein
MDRCLDLGIVSSAKPNLQISLLSGSSLRSTRDHGFFELQSEGYQKAYSFIRGLVGGPSTSTKKISDMDKGGTCRGISIREGIDIIFIIFVL